MRFIINGIVASQKNRKKMSVVGGRPRLYTEKSVKDWQTSAHQQIKQQWDGVTIQSKVSIRYDFYFPDNRRRDLDNCIASINDQLIPKRKSRQVVWPGVLKDDCWTLLEISGAYGHLDKDNPRAEITIDIL